MDYFLTTYAKDYKWPVVVAKKVDDTSAINEATALAKEKYTEIIDTETKSKQRADEDIVPAQVGAPPAGPGSKFDQPSTYLRKLYTKYPYLYEIMKITPPAELAKKVYAARYQTTYQEDYGSNDFLDFQNKVGSIVESKKKEEARADEATVCIDRPQRRTKEEKECACSHDANYKPCTCAKDGLTVPKIAAKPASISKMIRMPRDKEPKKPKKEDKEKG
ncbi:hypothetical protein O3M35_006949 [Rhynocoris fuscipes]|uniref:Uncharacterized protein n=1 Tax=Rhynocoris fuscipes TaxID=488301 RepID=A0AAW1DI09_9HEMI